MGSAHRINRAPQKNLRAAGDWVRRPPSKIIAWGPEPCLLGEAMTEAEWMSCTNPFPMLEFLRKLVSPRKLRLFAVACCHRAWDLLDEHSRTAVEVFERDANGLRKIEAMAVAELGPCFGDLRASRTVMLGLPPWWLVVTTLLCGLTENVKQLVAWIDWSLHERANDTHAALRAVPGDEVRAAKAAWAKAQEQAFPCNLLREIFGNPFHQVTLDSSWLTPEVVSLAQQVYDGRAFDRMPELAVALEEAGCKEPEILEHCRGKGQHVRGCWVLDRILGKE